MYASVRRSLFSLALILTFSSVSSAQQKAFEGTWQMDAAKSKVSDGRNVTLVIEVHADSVKMSFTTKKGADAATSEFTSKLDGKPCEFPEGSHKSQLTVWWDGSTWNASKEKGPAVDVTSMWKFELGPDKQTLTLTINHYDPAADDEKLIFAKK